MTSPLLSLNEIFHAPESSAQLPCGLFLEVQTHDRHRDQLPVARLGERGKADTNNAVFLGEFSDEVGVRVRGPLVEDHDGLFDRSALSDDRHADSYGFVSRRVDWRARRASIVEFNRMAEGGR